MFQVVHAASVGDRATVLSKSKDLKFLTGFEAKVRAFSLFPLRLFTVHGCVVLHGRAVDLPVVSGLRGRPRGGGDDPRGGLRFSPALRLWCPEHDAAHPEPHPRHAAPPPHPPARGDLLPPPEDGRLLPHLLQAECADPVQGHVPGGVQQLRPEEAERAGGASCCVGWGGGVLLETNPDLEGSPRLRGWNMSLSLLCPQPATGSDVITVVTFTLTPERLQHI